MRASKRNVGWKLLLGAGALALLLAGCAPQAPSGDAPSGAGQTAAPPAASQPAESEAAPAQTLSGEEAVAQLVGSIQYTEGQIAFTIPENGPEGEDWNILVYGTTQMGNGGMSVHLFEEENMEGSWQPGETYTIPLEGLYRALGMDVALWSQPDAAQTVDLLDLAGQPTAAPIDEEDGKAAQMTNRVTVDFPAYPPQEGQIAPEAPAFTASFLLPEGWQVKQPEGESALPTPDLFTPMDLYDDKGQLAGSIGYGVYEEAEEGQEPPAEEYYKVVYAYLRNSRVCRWDPYTRVKRTAQSENGVAQVHFVSEEGYDQAEDMAALPEHTAPGVLGYDREMRVFVGIRFVEGVALTEPQVETVAQSLTLAQA